MRLHSLPALSAAVYLTACAGDAVSPPRPDAARPSPETTPRAELGIATLGLLIERHGSTLVLKQQEPELRATSSVRARAAQQELAIGHGGHELRVMTDASTAIYVKGVRVSSLSAVPLQTQLLVAGTRQGNSLRAKFVTDLSGAGPPTAEQRTMFERRMLNATSSSPATPTIQPSAAAAGTTSLCVGQDMDYVDPNVHEFHGCWGGPVVSDNWDVGAVPIFCPLVGCFVIDEVSFTFALGGWVFDWPFRFQASSASGLIYHVPSAVSMNVTPLPALGTAFTFSGGLGFDYGLNIDFCHPTIAIPPEIVCDNLGTFHLSILSMIHQTSLAGPLKGTERLEIAEVGCPSVGVLVIPNVPFDPLALGLCEDLDLVGRPFTTRVTTDGTGAPSVGTFHSFNGDAQSLTVRPDAPTVAVSFSEFSWSPQMEMGFFFRLKSFGITLWDSPSIPITGGAWPAISTPFPGQDFTVATDPLSPIGNPSYLFQPTVATVAVFPVAPAPTQLAILSSPTLAEGSPVIARLTESYDGSPIAGAQVRFVVTNGDGQHTVFAATNLNGIVQTLLPNGEHALSVQFEETDVYLSSSASQGPVYVYRPMTFVIWGGNADGIVAEGRYNFWGSQWHKQVTGGAFNADASFKGYAFAVSDASWVGAPDNSVQPPAQLVEYISVIVTTQTALDGVNTVGNVAGRVVLRVESPSSYAPNPGHRAWGVVKAHIAPISLTGADGS
ncbi:MAG TPA: hypothetical protein VJ755_06050 [Gemmatimonadales bacterium]|nr:hypothetical protein [Gemmatimonadales bacterium]